MGDALVWTWESCDDAHGGGTPGHLVASGSEGSQPSCASSHTPNGVRCCADSEWYGVRVRVRVRVRIRVRVRVRVSLALG